ncbi:Uncharacterised protein [Mycobacteroides abscessus subsp. abscessus]|nr:Uncharacterised protein [Mycobacteroides abscessus subsp. abscessus]
MPPLIVTAIIKDRNGRQSQPIQASTNTPPPRIRVS